jgi:hypothetical protein
LEGMSGVLWCRLDLCAQLSGYLGRLHRSLMIANCSKAQSNGETYGSLAMRDICVLQCGEDALPKPCHPQVRLCNIPKHLWQCCRGARTPQITMTDNLELPPSLQAVLDGLHR